MKYSENIVSALFQTAHQGNTSAMLLVANYVMYVIIEATETLSKPYKAAASVIDTS